MIQVFIREIHDQKDLDIKAEPYTIKGRLQVRYVNDKWSFKEILAKHEAKDNVQPTHYDIDKYKPDYVILGAYVDDKCVGFAFLERQSRTRYLYVKEIRTHAEYTNQGIGTKLAQYCFDKALSLGYRGIYAVTPDNHLDSCHFFMNNGFRIGGLDTEYYMGTANEGKKDVIFYRG